MSVFLLVLIWWILAQLSAPTWCFVCFAVVVFIKLIDVICEAIKAAIESYDKWKDK